MRGLLGGFTGDWHYGLKVEDLDRTPEIDAAVTAMVDRAIEKNYDFFSICGDATDNNTPHPDEIALLLKQAKRLNDAGICTFWSLGNHEAVSIAGRDWGLTPLQSAGYENVHFILEPKLIEMEASDFLFLFLPFATRQRAMANGYESARDYIEDRAAALLDEAGKRKVVVVSHYNVDGARAGTEQYMLRQTDLGLPSVLVRSPKVIQIFNSHVHSPQDLGKVVFPGSPVCTDFGDVDDNKGFVEARIGGGECKWRRVRTPSSPLHEFELDFTGKDVHKRRKLVESCGEFLEGGDAIVKLRVIVEEERVPEVDFDGLTSWFAKRSRFVKSVDRVTIRKRQTRDRTQTAALAPIDAVKKYIASRNPDRADDKLKLALEIMAGEAEVDNGKVHPAAVESQGAALESLRQTLRSVDTTIYR